MSITTERIPNRLIHEKSPYLLQHAYNPVDWFPWGDDAFKKAKEEDKPVFISIGYSACHWCHVMEEESFSDNEIAELLNKYFVSIKVDREERPDIDNVYMKAAMALIGSGGWPLNLFLTPDKLPFYAGTYFSPEDKPGVPGLKTVLLSLAETWKNQRQAVLDSAGSVINVIAKSQIRGEKYLDEVILNETFEIFLSSFDNRYGGFGNSTKFPITHRFSFLLRYWVREKDERALEMTEKTLIEMLKGGICDQVGGGFHRYSTDKKWFLPHFEKMLYDQALISRLYLEAYQVTGKPEYASIARQTLNCVLRDLAHPEGVFYSSLDADSNEAEGFQMEPLGLKPKVPRGAILERPLSILSLKGKVSGRESTKKEGAFYLWTKKQVNDLFRKDNPELVCYYFGIKDEGNVSIIPSGEFKGKNILFCAHTIDETAQHFQKGAVEVGEIVERAKKILFDEREKRPKPRLDDKVLTDWNGLMISALSLGASVLNESCLKEAAVRCARFILKSLKDNKGFLLHRFKDDEAKIDGLLDDYAFLIQGLIDLYQATFDIEYLREARSLADKMIELFFDENERAFFATTKNSQDLPFRTKDIHDEALPSGNSVACLDLLRLSRLTMDKRLEEKAESLFKTFSLEVSQLPIIHTQLLIAFDFSKNPRREIVVAEGRSTEETVNMLSCIHKKFMPNAVIVLNPAKEQEAKNASILMPLLKGKSPLEGKATVYICENYTCKAPITSLADLQSYLEKE